MTAMQEEASCFRNSRANGNRYLLHLSVEFHFAHTRINASKPMRISLICANLAHCSILGNSRCRCQATVVRGGGTQNEARLAPDFVLVIPILRTKNSGVGAS